MPEHSFIRKYELIIGKHEHLGTKKVIRGASQEEVVSEIYLENEPDFIFREGALTKLDELVTTIPSSFKKWTELHITATIGAGKESKAPAVFKMYNLSSSSFRHIETGSLVIFKAGYETDSELPVIYTGQIDSVTTAPEGKADMVTTITCKDAATIKNNLRVSKSFPPKGATYLDVINWLISEAAAAGIPKGHFLVKGASAAIKDKIHEPFFRTVPIVGNLFRELNKLCDALDYRAYTVLGKLYVEPTYLDSKITTLFTLPQDAILEVSPAGGGGRGKLDASPENKKTIKLKTFLDGRITPNKAFTLEGKFEGTYNVVKVNHVFSYEGSSCYTEILGSRL